MSNTSDQLGFDALLADAAAENRQHVFGRDTAHLPGVFDEAVPYLKNRLVSHHKAMLAADLDTAMEIRKEAHLLATKLNGGRSGILAHDDAPGCALERAVAAKPGDVPIWGQRGTFEATIETGSGSMSARVEMGGLFGIGATAMPFLGFSVRAVDPNGLFLSSTGYRSFLGCTVPLERGLTTEVFACRIMTAHCAQTLKGQLVRIDPKWESSKS